jgi:hypothetical protein
VNATRQPRMENLMSASYQHWDSEKTIARMFGDHKVVGEMVEAFMAQYPDSLRALSDDKASIKRLSDELHTLRSLLGIFNADTGLAMAVVLDRSVRAGMPIVRAEIEELVSEINAFVAELEHYLSAQKS